MMAVQCGFDDPHQLVVEGPTIEVQVGFGDDLEDVAYPALIDTGATSSAIDSLLASELALPVVDRQLVAGIGGGLEVNVHLARIRIPDLGVDLRGRFTGVHLTAGGQLHRVLLGRNILSHLNMTYDGPSGSVVLTRPG